MGRRGKEGAGVLSYSLFAPDSIFDLCQNVRTQENSAKCLVNCSIAHVTILSMWVKQFLVLVQPGPF